MNDQEFSDLAERTQQIVEMAGSPAWELFTDRAFAEINKHEALVLSGTLGEPEYRRESGWLQGARRVLQLPATVSEEFEREALRRETEKQVERETEE